MDERIQYGIAHRFTMKTVVEMLSESDREHVLLSELGGKRVKSIVRRSIEQTVREELRVRMTLDDWAEETIVEPLELFVQERVVNPVVKIITSPFKNMKSLQIRRKGTRAHNGILQDMLTGREEKNQLANPLNDEGIPGEEISQPARLPQKFALGARVFRASPYGYGTLRFGDIYAQARISAAEMFDAPRLNEASLLFQTLLDPHEIILSFGGTLPFKNMKNPERYWGLYGFAGLSKIFVDERKFLGEAYIEGRAGSVEQGGFLGVRLRY